MKGWIWASAAACALMAGGAAQAQDRDAAPVPQSSPAANSPQGAAVTSTAPEQATLQELVVTAQRVTESSQRAPIAVDVIKPEELVRQNVVNAAELSRTTPALAASNAGGPATVFFVRGVGNTTVNAYSDPAIAFNYDGVYIGRPSSTSGLFYDLQRVEVLKGPQGTLYGRNATGGAINVIPNRPVLGVSERNFTASYGNYDWFQGQAAVNAPLGEHWALRAAGLVSRHDGFQSDGTASQREYAARLQLYGELSEAATLRLGFDYSHQGGAGDSGFYLGAVDPTFGPSGFAGYGFTPSGFSPSQGVNDPRSEAYLASRFVSQAGRAGATLSSYPRNDNDYWGVTGEFNWTTDIGVLTIQPAYRDARLDYDFTNSMRDGFSKEHDHQTSIEARWAGRIGTSIDYLVGGLYFDESIDATAIYNQLVLTPYQQFTTNTRSYAGFGKLTFHATDKLSFTAGGRYTADHKRFDGTSTVYLLFCGDPSPPQDFCPDLPFEPVTRTAAELEQFYTSRGIPVTPVPLYVLPGAPAGAPFVLKAPMAIDSSLDNDRFTYRLAAQYDLTSRNMVYASYETGYHSGGFSFAQGLDTYEPETIDAYTVGSKNRFLGDRLQVNLEAFLWKYHNQQYSQYGFDLGDPPATVFLTRNIGDSTIKGVDLDVQMLATPDTLLSATVQYLDTRYDSFVYYTPNQGLPPITACDYAPATQTTPSGGTLAVFRVDCSGRPAFNSPKWSIYLNAQQTVPLGSNKLVLQAGTRYRSSAYPAPDYLPWTRAKANFVSDASVTFARADDQWFVTAFVDNIEDNRRLTGVVDNAAASVAAANVEQPRTFGVRVGGKF